MTRSYRITDQRKFGADHTVQSFELVVFALNDTPLGDYLESHLILLLQNKLVL